MSGALLETAGQVRNAYPFIVRKTLNVAVTLVNGTPALQTYSRTLITENIDIPFDYGPDKAGRVYMVINGFSVVINSDVYNVAGIIAGNLYFQDAAGIEYSMLALGETLEHAKAFNRDTVTGIYTPLFSDKPNYIGAMLWRDTDSVISTLSNTFAHCNLNIGYYGDYAEYDFNELKRCEHHHYHGIDRAELVDQTKV